MYVQVLLSAKLIDPPELDFLLRFPVVQNVTSPVDFLSNHCWGGIKALSVMEQFRNLDRDIEVQPLSLFNTLIIINNMETSSVHFLKGCPYRHCHYSKLDLKDIL